MRVKQAAARLLKKYNADKLFDKKEASRFVLDTLKAAGCPRAQHLLGFDAWFKQLDMGKKGKLEMASMTSLALKVAKFSTRERGRPRSVATKPEHELSSSQLPYTIMKAVD